MAFHTTEKNPNNSAKMHDLLENLIFFNFFKKLIDMGVVFRYSSIPIDLMIYGFLDENIQEMSIRTQGSV